MAANSAALLHHLTTFSALAASIIFQGSAPQQTTLNPCKCNHFDATKVIFESDNGTSGVSEILGGRCGKLPNKPQVCFVDGNSQCEDKTLSKDIIGDVDRCDGWGPEGYEVNPDGCRFLSFDACREGKCECNNYEDSAGDEGVRGRCHSRKFNHPLCFVNKDSACKDKQEANPSAFECRSAVTNKTDEIGEGCRFISLSACGKQNPPTQCPECNKNPENRKHSVNGKPFCFVDRYSLCAKQQRNDYFSDSGNCLPLNKAGSGFPDGDLAFGKPSHCEYYTTLEMIKPNQTTDKPESQCFCSSAEQKMFDATNPKRIPCNNQMNGKPYCLVDVDSKCEDFSDSELCPSGDCDAVDLLKKCSGAGCGGVSSLACATQYSQEFGEGLKCQYQSDCPAATHEELRQVLKIVNTSKVIEEPGQCKQLKFQCFKDSCEIYFSPLHPGPDGGDVTWSCRPCSSSGVQFPGASSRQGDQECPDFCSCPCGCRFTAIHPGTNDVFSGTPALDSNSLLGQGFLK